MRSTLRSRPYLINLLCASSCSHTSKTAEDEVNQSRPEKLGQPSKTPSGPLSGVAGSHLATERMVVICTNDSRRVDHARATESFLVGGLGPKL